MSEMVVGIDPGLCGAVVLFGEGMEVYDMPTFGDKKQRAVDCTALASILSQTPISTAFLERVSAMRGWGSGSIFRFGEAFGAIRGVLGALNIPVRFVSPVTWKKSYGLSGGDDAKEASRRKAIEFFPTYAKSFARKLDHNRAEAALIAYWGAKQA